jgi:MFS family permease
MIAERKRQPFFGWVVVWAAFVTAIFGWGVGFYGPPVFLKAVQDAHGWSVSLVSAAVTLHFLVGAVLVANLPRLHRRFGLPAVTATGAAVLAVGVLGWSLAQEPWQLFLATLLSGGGWVTLGAAAINAMVSPWFVRRRPAALSTAYNGASIGGVVFSPLVGGVDRLGRVSAGSGDGRRCHDHGCGLPRLARSQPVARRARPLPGRC